jgi:hypothetical protein
MSLTEIIIAHARNKSIQEKRWLFDQTICLFLSLHLNQLKICWQSTLGLWWFQKEDSALPAKIY